MKTWDPNPAPTSLCYAVASLALRGGGPLARIPSCEGEHRVGKTWDAVFGIFHTLLWHSPIYCYAWYVGGVQVVNSLGG